MQYKIFFSVILFICFCVTVFPQTGGLKKTIPPFNIERTDNTHFASTDLQKNIPVMLVYFSTTCDHCREFTKQFLGRTTEFGNMQTVMVSYGSLAEIAKFETEFTLNKYPGIITGTEGYTFVVQKYYKIINFPFIALFNAKGELTAIYRTAPTVDEIIVQFKKMK